ncbi:hypothetical protein CCR94_13000 [Rhodoblastus sphagnicola]|uniref:Uncharacterized protein n=1 Tax=Rhodoblastus sphagnicola TaxID=333368 RepID=A0A2S6N6J1_9HYPH|nr:hypothetical protein CCR94_13000 [Rhodoblastus sphagnicola]
MIFDIFRSTSSRNWPVVLLGLLLGPVVTKPEIKKAPFGTRIKRQLQESGSAPACFWRFRYYDEDFGHVFHSPGNTEIFL